jgi:hypothetical protein
MFRYAHISPTLSSPEGEGFNPSLKGTLTKTFFPLRSRNNGAFLTGQRRLPESIYDKSLIAGGAKGGPRGGRE